MNWKAWLFHLLSAGVSGAANAALACFVDPSSFNLNSAKGWEHVGLLALLGFLVPVLSVLKDGLPGPVQQQAPVAGMNAGGNVKSIAIVAVAISLSLAAGAASAQTATAPAPAASTSLFTASSEVTALSYKGAWSVANHTTESFDLMDFGASKADHLILEGHEISAPTPGFGSYLGGIRIVPNISKIVAKTNLPSSNFGIYFQGAAGIAQLPKTSSFSFLAGGGLDYRLSSALSWSTLHAGWLKVGSQSAYEISTGLTAFFGSK